MYLFYGCRRSNEDFLYKSEWPAYQAELDGKFIMRTAFSREMTKSDGGKVYVQDQLWDEKDQIAPLILDKRAYVYICGDAHSMSKAVESTLARMMAEARGGDAEVGAKELKLLKDRNVSLVQPYISSGADILSEAQDGRLELIAFWSRRNISQCGSIQHSICIFIHFVYYTLSIIKPIAYCAYPMELSDHSCASPILSKLDPDPSSNLYSLSIIPLAAVVACAKVDRN
jgi:hypothetical protein